MQGGDGRAQPTGPALILPGILKPSDWLFGLLSSGDRYCGHRRRARRASWLYLEDGPRSPMRLSILKPCFPTMRPVATNVRNVVRMAVPRWKDSGTRK